MRQFFLMISVLLLGLSWAAAQDSTPATGSATSSASAGQTSQTSSGGEQSVEGCLSGQGGNYMLTDKNGNTYQLTGDTAKLSEHVGHEVRIMGTASSAGSAAGSQAAGSSAGTAGSQQTLQVSSVKHISKTCKTGTGMSH